MHQYFNVSGHAGHNVFVLQNVGRCLQRVKAEPAHGIRLTSPGGFYTHKKVGDTAAFQPCGWCIGPVNGRAANKCVAVLLSQLQKVRYSRGIVLPVGIALQGVGITLSQGIAYGMANGMPLAAVVW